LPLHVPNCWRFCILYSRVLGRPKFPVSSESASSPCCRVTATSPTHFPRSSCVVVAHIRHLPRITPPPIGWAVTVSFRPRL
ncbi:Hypothetical predicted protein, partial [Prunus dulcis]